MLTRMLYWPARSPFSVFQPVAPERFQLIESRGRIEDFQAAVGLARKAVEFANHASFGKGLRPVVAVAQDHPESGISILTHYVQRIPDLALPSKRQKRC